MLVQTLNGDKSREKFRSVDVHFSGSKKIILRKNFWNVFIKYYRPKKKVSRNYPEINFKDLFCSFKNNFGSEKYQEDFKKSKKNFRKRFKIFLSKKMSANVRKILVEKNPGKCSCSSI